MRRAQTEGNFDDNAGANGKCLRNRSEKGSLRSLRAHQMRNRPLPGGSGNIVDQNRLNPCQARPFDLNRELDRRVKTEIPVKRFSLRISHHAALAPLLALSIYATSACLIFAHHHFFFRHGYFGTVGDPQLFIWFLSWFPYAMRHHLNPFITHFVWAPEGINLTWSTCIPSLALIAWPITALWGPVFSFNIVTMSGPVLAAFAAFLLCTELTDRCIPSLVGGWLFGFSSYETGQLMGHLPLDFIACVPLLVWLAALRYRHKITSPMFVAASAITLVFQFGTSVEVFATATLFGSSALALSYLLRAADRELLTEVAIGLGCSYLLCLVLVSPYLYYMAKEWLSVPVWIQPPNVYVADLMNYVVPTRITAVGGPWAVSISKTFTGNDSENGAYLGLPLVMIIGAFAVTSWRCQRAQVLLLMFVVLVLCSFGPYLHFEGRSLWPMPWWLGEKLALLRQALPVRFSLYISLAAGIMVALWLASMSDQRSMIRYVLAALAVLTLVPNTRGKRAYWFTDLRDLHIPAFFSDGDYKRVLEPGDNVIVLPYGHLGYSMLWQATSDMYFRMAGGYVTAYTPAAFARWPVVQMFYAGRPDSGFKDNLTAFCAANAVRAVILANGAGNGWDLALAKTGWERSEMGGVFTYRDPRGRNAASVSGVTSRSTALSARLLTIAGVTVSSPRTSLASLCLIWTQPRAEDDCLGGG